MAKGYTSKSAKKTASENTSDRQPVERNGKNKLDHTKLTNPVPDNGGDHQCHTSVSAANTDKIQSREQALHQLETDLSRREISLIEREIKILSLQQEIDNLRPLSGLYRVVKAMATERKLESLLEVIARETKTMLKCDRCSVFVLDNHHSELWAQIAQGLDGQRTIRVPLSGNSIVSLCARTARVINIPDAYDDPRFDPDVDKVTGYNTRTILCVPMHSRNGNVIGVFEVMNKDSGIFTDEDQEWLQALAAVAGGLIEQAQQYSEIEHFVDKTLETLAQTIDKRDPLTAGHSIRVTKYSLLIGERMTIGEDERDVLRYAAMMHDYGKIGVPEAILWKNGRLTPEEYACVQTHAKITYDLLSNLPFTSRLANVPFVASCHHEKLDGSGYYRGLKGHEIPFLARVITTSDVFDALTSVRHYRNRMSITKVFEIMESGRENHFDPEVVDSFYSLPCDRVLKVMESERGTTVPEEIKSFANISWLRLVELCQGAKPKTMEEGLKEAFFRIYNANLPADYQELD